MLNAGETGHLVHHLVIPIEKDIEGTALAPISL